MTSLIEAIHEVLEVLAVATGHPDYHKHPARASWWSNYGRFDDPVSTVWLHRDQEHQKAQAIRDASQNVMTRLV